MLELSSRQIVFVYSEGSILTAHLNIRNQLPNTYISYKIKTTTPDYFEVNPNKGVLQSGHTKTIQFKTNRVLNRVEAKSMAVSEKFLIQCIPLPDKRKPQQIEQLWVAYKNDPSKLENTRLKLRVEGIESMSGSINRFTENIGGSDFKSRATATFAAGSEGHGSHLNMHNEQITYTKLQELKKQQERLEYQREEVIRTKAVVAQVQSKSILPYILVFALCFVAGIGLSKYIFHPKHHDPSSVIITGVPSSSSNRYETVKQLQIKGPPGNHGAQRIIVTNEDNSQVILTNDGSSQPIRLTVKRTQMEDGTQKVIIS